MANSEVCKNFLDGGLTLGDGTDPAVTLEVDHDLGDLAFAGLAETQRNVAAYESRGVLKSARHTTRTYVTGSFSLYWMDVTDAADNVVLDFLMRTGAYDANKSTLAGDVYAIDLIFTVSGEDLGDDDNETITFTKCHCVIDGSEGDPNTITVNFTCYGDVTRVAVASP